MAKESPRLMVFMPPQHGKTELISRRLPAFALGKYPWLSIIATSYNDELSSRNNRDVQRIIDSPEYVELFPDTRLPSGERTNRKRTDKLFELVGQEGSYRSAGAGAGISGMGAHILIGDDLVKDAAEANSDSNREALWNWYVSTFNARKRRGAGILLVMTRWNQDDICGRLEKREPGKWKIVRFPALAEVDEEHRKTGEALAPFLHTQAELEATKELSDYYWAAVYQQRPSPLGGGRIKAAKIEIVDALPTDLEYVRGWDFASTDAKLGKKIDYTSGVKIGRKPMGSGYKFFIADVRREGHAPDDVEALLKQVASLDGKLCQQSIPQDPGQAGKSQALNMTRLIAGVPVFSSTESGDKVTRADPFAAQVNVGNVAMLRAEWNQKYIDELAAFPTGANDDQVDASSRAFNYWFDSSSNLLEFFKQQALAKVAAQR